MLTLNTVSGSQWQQSLNLSTMLTGLFSQTLVYYIGRSEAGQLPKIAVVAIELAVIVSVE